MPAEVHPDAREHKRIRNTVVALLNPLRATYVKMELPVLESKVTNVRILFDTNPKAFDKRQVGIVENALRPLEAHIQKQKGELAAEREKEDGRVQRETRLTEKIDTVLAILKEPQREYVNGVRSKLPGLKDTWKNHPKVLQLEEAVNNAEIILKEKELREQVSNMLEKGKLKEEAKEHFDALTTLVDDIEIEEAQLKKASTTFMGNSIGGLLKSTAAGVKPGCMAKDDYNTARLVVDYLLTVADLFDTDKSHLKFTDDKLKEVATVCFEKK